MSLFSKKKAKASPPDDAEPTAQEPEAEPSEEVTDTALAGPYDVSEVEGRGGRLGLGAIWLPVIPGMKVGMDVDRASKRPVSVTVTVDGSRLQIQAFAAPRTAGIWDDIREELAASATSGGGTVTEVDGPFGKEIHADLAGEAPKSKNAKPGAKHPVRFIGVDGPRWFLRGVISGRAARDPKAAAPLEAIFRGTVVVRGTEAHPPRELLALTPPERKAVAAVEGADGDDSAAKDADGVPSLMKRGPEITEIR